MNNALWLIAALPEWYFSCLLDPLSAGFLTVIPAIGAIALLGGAASGIMIRRRGLLLFAIPFLASESLVAFAGFFRGQVGNTISVPLRLLFLGFVLILSATLVWRLNGARLAALLLATFPVTYALFAAFVAAMSFSDSWL